MNSKTQAYGIGKAILRWRIRCILVATVDATLLATAWLLAHAIRFEGAVPSSEGRLMWMSLPLAALVPVAALWSFGLYQRIWRYAGVADLTRIATALFVGVLCLVTAVFLSGVRGHSRLVFLGFYALAVLLLAAFRVGLRNVAMLGPRGGKGAPSLIVGTGDTGELVIREIRRNPALPFKPLGIVATSPSQMGLRIHNVPVVGTIDDLPFLISDLGIEEVIVADPELNGEQYKHIVALCQPSGTSVRVFPSPSDLLDGHVEVSRVRRIQVEDLLRRPTVPPDRDAMNRYLHAKRVMITGAGGSIGSELARQVCGAHPAFLVLLDRAESALYEIDLELSERASEIERAAILADVGAEKRMHDILERHKPDIIFHAAAFKHVPLMESHPCEVVLNNVIATEKLTRLAQLHGVRDFVLISSDKAVNPVNVMGASKRVAELWVQLLAHRPTKDATKFLAVRFGNVLGSTGSVIPRLRRQIEQGGPVTITHPQMTRYFMTIQEAAQLVIEAAAMAEGGEIFVLDMGAPVNMVDLARDLISLSGMEPGRDIAITFTGLRPGEKLEESLWSETEQPQPTKNPKIHVIRSVRGSVPLGMEPALRRLEKLAVDRDVPRLLEVLHALVPEFQPQIVEEPAGPIKPRAYRVLVADDDPELRELMAIALRRHGMEVACASHGLEAWELLHRFSPDLVVLDLRMPGMDGLSLFERIKRDPSTCELPVMLITAHAELGEETKNLECEVDDFISKPFRLAEFLVRVRAILRRREAKARARGLAGERLGAVPPATASDSGASRGW